ncbi:Serine/Threonine kinase domain protein (macronuclear) [Tetrahymena thermophila SB210]|uniref:mitogen-activated protein kinase kinase n=1 Tax=Tetrahymena thermophila (strain SB210) TaxID=312017 RepID=Q23EB9_TETTS|nr:Serine/Threonine kinase domain protein [Tetrahymena thermophila SB210]EAR94834.2 Serine/Threonine kinase domain protein [Tetrahymena thermophila SB210]|eukprot:XP_001015079.2 Serine/Threonine kinase domain protein [Tetrahymena thermophila SB210]
MMKSASYLILSYLIAKIFCTTFTLIDYTPNLLAPLNLTESQRVIYTCNHNLCYSITRFGFIDWTGYKEVIRPCENETFCYPFPSDDTTDVYTNSIGTQVKIYWIDPTERKFYNVIIDKYIGTYITYTVSDAVRFQYLNDVSTIYIETETSQQEKQVLLYSNGQYFNYFSLPKDCVYWIIQNQLKFLFYQNEIQCQQGTQTPQIYQLEGQGIIDPLQQIQFINMQIFVKIYIPQTQQMRLLQFNEIGNLIYDVTIPNIITIDQMYQISSGIINGMNYYQSNSTLIINTNQTFYSASLYTTTPIIFFQMQYFNVWVCNQQYFQPFILNQSAINDTSSLYQKLNQQLHINLNQSQLSLQQQQEAINYHQIKFHQNNSQIGSLQIDDQAIYDQNHFRLIQNLVSNFDEQSSQIQQLQDSGALYINSKQPCIIKLQNGDQIQVTSLQIDLQSITYKVNQNSVLNYYFSAKVNGKWMLFKSSLKQQIHYTQGRGSSFTFITIALTTYFFLRGSIYFYSAFVHRKEYTQMQEFIIKQTQTKISEELFNKCYTILTDNKLGEGAFGVVYKCQYTPSEEYSFMKKYKQNQMFACKVLTKTDQNMEMITQEIDALESVRNCQSAIKMINYSIGNEKVYIVLELAKYSLEDCIQMKYGNRFSDNEIIQIALDLVEVLVQLRNCNFNHRDIKPSNILIMEDENKIKLTDFGAAKRINISNFTKKSDELIGSLSWMAPELVQAIEQYDEEQDDNSLSQIDYEKCDIFSLGLTLLYCILKIKLKGCNRFEYILNNYFSNLDKQHSNIDKEFRILLRKMTSFDPKKRPTCFIIRQHLLDITRQSYQQLLQRSETTLTVNK